MKGRGTLALQARPPSPACSFSSPRSHRGVLLEEDLAQPRLVGLRHRLHHTLQREPPAVHAL